ncbi:hypothetical protein B0H13DRAFT_2668590 [Mycena leptocephala]|nr:hypothetical protein B0H13DRAFT_2668590 [Mycena leptocephala]
MSPPRTKPALCLPPVRCHAHTSVLCTALPVFASPRPSPSASTPLPHLPLCPADRRLGIGRWRHTEVPPSRGACPPAARVATRRTRDASIDPYSREHGSIPSPSQSRSASLPHFLSLPASTPPLPSPLLRPVNIDPARCSARAARVHSRAAFLGGTSLHPSPPPSSLLPRPRQAALPIPFSRVDVKPRAMMLRRCPYSAPPAGVREHRCCIVHTLGHHLPTSHIPQFLATYTRFTTLTARMRTH